MFLCLNLPPKDPPVEVVLSFPSRSVVVDITAEFELDPGTPKKKLLSHRVSCLMSVWIEFPEVPQVLKVKNNRKNNRDVGRAASYFYVGTE